jgi:Zn-dependent alcohol dehydrogenase
VEGVRRELLYLVERHATVIVVGETGCGKTTQIPRFLHEAGWTAEGHQVRVRVLVGVGVSAMPRVASLAPRQQGSALSSSAPTCA